VYRSYERVNSTARHHLCFAAVKSYLTSEVRRSTVNEDRCTLEHHVGAKMEADPRRGRSVAVAAKGLKLPNFCCSPSRSFVQSSTLFQLTD